LSLGIVICQIESYHFVFTGEGVRKEFQEEEAKLLKLWRATIDKLAKRMESEKTEIENRITRQGKLI
jgi:hypothetical protein